MPKTTFFFFFFFLDPPYFWAEGPKKKFDDFTKIFAKKKLTGLVPPPDPNLLIYPNLKCDCSLMGTLWAHYGHIYGHIMGQWAHYG